MEPLPTAEGRWRLNRISAEVPETDLELGLTGWGPLEVRPVFDTAPADRELSRALGLDRCYVIEAATEAAAAGLMSELSGRPDWVEGVERDGLGETAGGMTPNDPQFYRQWSLENTGQVIQGVAGLPGADVYWASAWAITRTSPGVVLAVLDSGVSQSHPDLAGRLVPGRNFVSADVNDTDDETTVSHGTQCAGVAAAVANNGIGIAGLAPSTRIMPVKVTSGAIGFESTVAAGLVWAADNGARVASISLAFSSGSTVLRDAVTYAFDRGVVMCAAVGNDPSAPVAYPARWSKVIAVGATTNLDVAYQGQSVGAEIDVVAPGVQIYTTVDRATNPDGYAWATGTSMAAPMVAAQACLIRSLCPNMSVPEVHKVIGNSADDLGPPGQDPIFGKGRINIQRAINVALTDGSRCIADWNGNGVVALADIFEFLGAWFGELSAYPPILVCDIDRNGLIQMTDFALFLEAWFVGCPPLD